jgi:Fe2+ or Zn2+ uptake regulation protein
MKLSNTLQRRVIIEELRKVKSHPTADELYQLVRQRLPQVSLGTIYRNLELLSEDGQIQKLELTGKQKRFDGNVKEHYHMRCSNCGCIVDVEDKEIDAIHDNLQVLVERNGFDGFRLELIGRCSRCGNI